MKVVVLGFTLPRDLMDQVLAVDAHMPIQTHTFAWAVVEALRDAGVEVHLLSAQPLASYPGNPKVLARGGGFSTRGVEGRFLPFVNLTLVKHVTRLASGIIVGLDALNEWRPDALIVHGVHSPFLVLARFFRRVFGIPVVTILTDPPGVVLPTDGMLVTGLKRVDRVVVRVLLRGHDGVIALTPAIAEHIAAGLPALVMEGIVGELPEEPVGPLATSEATPATVIYAGGLSREYGVDRLIEAVRGLPTANVRLQLFGRGDLEDCISQIAATDARIRPPRYAERSEVLRAYAQADVLVQPRPIEQDFVRFSFPSKLMEYLASGTPVVTTRLPGIPEDYADHVEWADADDSQGLGEAIARVLAFSPDIRRDRGAKARDFVWRTRGRANQGQRMRLFIEGLVRRS